MANINDLMPSKYLKTSDFREPKVVTVKELKKANVARQDQEPEYKFIAFFEEVEKGLVLNKTNIKRLGKYLGDDTDDWPGGKVEIYVDENVTYGSDIVEGLRIRGAAKKAVAARRDGDEDVNRKLRAAADDDIPF
jgi:hypothetical protein